MQVKKATLNPLQTNCYFLIQDKKCIIIDPSIDTDGTIDKIISIIGENELIAIILTHGHYDHISAVDNLVDIYNVPVYIHKNDYDFLYNNHLNASTSLNPEFKFKSKVNELYEGEFTIENFVFKVVNTPGHTPGSCSLFIDNLCFSGDCVFRLSVGRTDLSGGSNKQMKESINFFKQLETDYKLLPGHGEETSLEFEKKFNPYFREL